MSFLIKKTLNNLVAKHIRHQGLELFKKTTKDMQQRKSWTETITFE